MFAVSSYSIVVSIHVIAVMIFLGVTFIFPIMMAATAGNPRHLAFALGVIHKVETKFVMPGAFLILATGLFQTYDGDRGWSFENDLWLSISLGLFVAVIIFVMTVMIPALSKAHQIVERAIAEAGPTGEVQLGPDFAAAAGIPKRFGPILGLVAIVIVFLMEAKPF